MKFYSAFYTDLPDQFVEANEKYLAQWMLAWGVKNPYFRKALLVDGVGLVCNSDPKKTQWPSICVHADRALEIWMSTKGANYDGRYWDSLAADQRDPYRAAGGAGRSASNYAVLAAATRNAMYQSLASQALGAGGLAAVWRDVDFAEKPKPPLKREMKLGEIVGYRCWRVERRLLRSVYQKDVWLPRQMLEGRELDDWDSRGIHAWKDAGSEHYHEYIRSYLNSQRRDPFTAALYGRNVQELENEQRPAMVTGSVFLWGDVVEHERGYRGEFARVRSLDWLYPDADMMGHEIEFLAYLKGTYGV